MLTFWDRVSAAGFLSVYRDTEPLQSTPSATYPGLASIMVIRFNFNSLNHFILVLKYT